jgi:hypothetical protein
VIDVMLSMNRWVSTSVSLAERSRLTEMRCVPSAEKTVSRAQSLCEPMKSVCSPLAASITRTLLSPQPTAMLFPSGDQAAP